jgi:hypothetical protein
MQQSRQAMGLTDSPSARVVPVLLMYMLMGLKRSLYCRQHPHRIFCQVARHDDDGVLMAAGEPYVCHHNRQSSDAHRMLNEPEGREALQ